jgi:hypothetical protein
MSRASRRRPARAKLISPPLGVAAVVAIVLVLFGSSSTQLTNPIAQAATVSAGAPGYRMHMTMAITAPVLTAPITASASGIVDLRDHAASMSMSIDFSRLPQLAQALGSSTMQLGMIMDGATIYMKFPEALAAQVPALSAKPWIKMDLAKLTGVPGVSSLMDNPAASDPTQMLRYLRAASDSVADEGQQEVDGLATTHYRAELSIDRLPDNLPPSERGALRQALSKLQQATQMHDFPVDVWVDAHHLVRRIVLSLGFHLASGPVMQETVTGDLTDYGPQPRPTPPQADQVRDLTSLVGASGLSGGGAGLGITPGG